MAEPRLQVDPLAEPRLSPVATPVDTFTHTNAGISLAQVAQGLSQFAPALARFTEGYNTDQQTEGEAAARRLHDAGKTYADAANEGLIPRHSNPFFMAGFKEQWGRVTADTFASDLKSAVAGSDVLQQSTDMKDFDQFVTKYREDWLNKNVDPNKRDQYFETGFGRRSDAYFSNERMDYAQQLGVRVQKMADDAHFQEVKEHVYNYAGHVAGSVIASDLMTLSDDMIAQGRDATKVNHSTADAIVAAAIQKAQEGDHNALDYLNIMKQVKAGTGLLSDTKYGSEQLDKGRQQVNNLLWQANERETQVATQKREARVRSTYTNVVQALAGDRHADLTPFIQQVADDPQAVGQLVDLQRNVNSLTFHTDEETKNDLFSRIWNDGNVTPQAITSWMQAGRLTSQDSAWLITQIGDAEDLQKKLKDKATEWNDFQFRQTLSGIDDQFKKGAVFTEADASRARYAKAMLMNAWVKHLSDPDGAKETDQQRGLWLQTTAERIVQYERNGFSTTPPQPNMKITNVDPMKTPILSVSAVRELGEVLKGNTKLSADNKRLLASYGITTPEQMAAFINAQLGFLKPQPTK